MNSEVTNKVLFASSFPCLFVKEKKLCVRKDRIPEYRINVKRMSLFSVVCVVYVCD